MQEESQRHIVRGAVVLAVMAALAWVPFAAAQLSREVAQAHLSPAIHSAFDIIRLSALYQEDIPFSTRVRMSVAR